MITVTALDRNQPKDPFLPLVVVAIRGSDSKVDHMVNANSKPKNASSFIVCHHIDFQGPCLYDRMSKSFASKAAKWRPTPAFSTAQNF